MMVTGIQHRHSFSTIHREDHDQGDVFRVLPEQPDRYSPITDTPRSKPRAIGYEGVDCTLRSLRLSLKLQLSESPTPCHSGSAAAAPGAQKHTRLVSTTITVAHAIVMISAGYALGST
ncbi:hypothetical protein EV363DRAFT_1219003 [Boletus edulis]|nr:hypothetical protein EV363DRAFT_1219003 [Boletus edulis]